MIDDSPDVTGGALALHGYPVSNYFNAARAALIEKGASFEIVLTRAGQDHAFLHHSAMGKIPYLRTPFGSIAETVAILEYIEDAVPGVALYPADAFDRARARQIINVVQIYVEAPLRTLFPGVFMGGINSPETIVSARSVIDRAVRALGYLVSPAPFLTGAQLTYADLFAFYTFDVGERVSQFVWDESLIDRMPGLREWFATLAARPSSRAVLSDFASAFAAYLQDKAAAWHEPAPEGIPHA